MYDQTFAAQFCEDDDLGGGLCHLWSSDHALLVIHHHHHRDHHHESDEDDVKKESEQLFISSASKVAQDDAAAEEEKSNQDKTQGGRSSGALDIFSLHITYLCLDTLQNQMTLNHFWVSSIFPLHFPVASFMIVRRKLVDSILFLFFYFGWATSGFDLTWQYCTLEYFDQSFTLKDVFLAVQDSSIVMVTWTGQIRNSCDVCVSKGELFLRWSEWLLRKLDKQIFSRVQISCAWSTLVQYKTCLLNGPPHFQSQGF